MATKEESVAFLDSAGKNATNKNTTAALADVKTFRLFGPVWSSAGKRSFMIEEPTVTLFKARNNNGSYRFYATFSAYATTFGRRTTDGDYNAKPGIIMYTRFVSHSGGQLKNWQIPLIIIGCADQRRPIFHQMDEIEPDVFELTEFMQSGYPTPVYSASCN